MTGMLLMIVGVISFVLGFVIYGKADKAAPVGVTIPEGLQKTARGKNLYDTVLAEQHKESKLQQAVVASHFDKPAYANKKAIDSNYRKDLNDVEAENLIAHRYTSEKELIGQNKKSGNDFEKFIVKMFSEDYFDLLDWTGDKSVEGRFSRSTYHPDLLLKPRRGTESDRFSVECKWKGKFYKDVIIASEEQIARYREYERRNSVPVFIALGIGGTGSKPNELFIVPLKDLQSNVIAMASLKRYEKDMNRMPYYDAEKRVLR